MQKVFKQVFGYALSVDPTRYVGPMASKNNANGTHDGSIVVGPISEPLVGRVYEKLIDNSVSDDEFIDYRVCVAGDEIPFVVSHRRALDKRFDANSLHTNKSKLEEDSVFSQDEQRSIVRFAKAMGLDVGELDVLRDRVSGKIYVVDVNKTPKSPPRNLSNIDYFRCLNRATMSLKKQYLT